MPNHNAIAAAEKELARQEAIEQAAQVVVERYYAANKADTLALRRAKVDALAVALKKEKRES